MKTATITLTLALACATLAVGAAAPLGAGQVSRACPTDPFARVSASGEASFGAHVKSVDNFHEGSYRVEFDRDVTRCSVLVSVTFVEPGVEAEAYVLEPDVTAVYVTTLKNAGPHNTTFDLVLRCAPEGFRKGG